VPEIAKCQMLYTQLLWQFVGAQNVKKFSSEFNGSMHNALG